MFVCIIIFAINCFLLFLFNIPSECYSKDENCYQKIVTLIIAIVIYNCSNSIINKLNRI